jgi:hypothetical protein
MRGFLHDVRLALRGLKGRPGFALVAVSTMALGIATASAIWSVVDAVLVRPLPFSEPERLVFVWEHQLARQRDRNVVGPANLVAWRERSRSFSGLAGFIRFDANLDGSGGERADPRGLRRATCSRSSARRAPRPHAPRVDSARGPRRRGALRSLLAASLRADPGVVGQTLRINGETSTVVGVMPESVQIRRVRCSGPRSRSTSGRARRGAAI